MKDAAAFAEREAARLMLGADGGAVAAAFDQQRSANEAMAGRGGRQEICKELDRQRMRPVDRRCDGVSTGRSGKAFQRRGRGLGETVALAQHGEQGSV